MEETHIHMWEPKLKLERVRDGSCVVTDNFNNQHKCRLQIGHEKATGRVVLQLWVPASIDKRYATARFSTVEDALSNIRQVSHAWAFLYANKTGRLRCPPRTE